MVSPWVFPSAKVWEATVGYLQEAMEVVWGKIYLVRSGQGKRTKRTGWAVCGVAIMRGHCHPELEEERKTGPPVLWAMERQLDRSLGPGEKQAVSALDSLLPSISSCQWPNPPGSQQWPPEAKCGLLELRAGAGAWERWVRRKRGRISSTFSFPLLNAKSTEQSLFPLFYRNGFCGKPGKINPANNYVSV